jgi:predicted transcriptional regulator
MNPSELADEICSLLVERPRTSEFVAKQIGTSEAAVLVELIKLSRAGLVLLSHVQSLSDEFIGN